jgi:cysteine desulfurase / selenocysteine lyase
MGYGLSYSIAGPFMDDHFFEQYRSEFPIAEKYIYFDHAGVSPLSLRVKNAIETFLAESVDGSAFHYPKWSQQIIDVRRACGRLIGSQPEEIAFVRSTSHGLSLVAEGLDWKPRDRVLVYEKEFPSNLYPWLNLRRKGVDVVFIPFRNGRIQVDDVARLIDSRTRLLSISSVQFTNGFAADLSSLGLLCRSRQVLFCVDAIQSLGILPMDVRAFNIDFLSADAHKWLLGPEGIGIFFCRQGLAERLQPALVGWKSVRNEFAFEKPDLRFKTDALRFEEGSMNVLGILGLGAAIELLIEVGIANIADRVLGLGDSIMQEAEKRRFTVLTPQDRGARGGNITFIGQFDPAKTRDALKGKGVMVNVRAGGLRVSPHFYNTAQEVERFFEILDRMI